MIFLALALLAIPVIYAHAPLNLEDIAKPRWVDNIGVMVTKSLASVRPEASVSPVDPIAAANLDEDLDYRIAQRTKSTDGWRAFLTAHPDGPHAQLARAELDKLVPPEAAPAPIVAEASDADVPDTKIPSNAAGSEPPSLKFAAATPASDEICREDEDRLELLSKSLTGDGVMRLLIDLRCEKLRPELLRLAERLDDKAPMAAADAAQDTPSSVLPGPVVSAPPLPPVPPPGMRANEPQNRTRPTLSSRAVESKRHANGRAAPNLPQFLLALFGEGPRNSTGVRRSRAGGGPGSGAGSGGGSR